MLKSNFVWARNLDREGKLSDPFLINIGSIVVIDKELHKEGKWCTLWHEFIYFNGHRGYMRACISDADYLEITGSIKNRCAGIVYIDPHTGCFTCNPDSDPMEYLKEESDWIIETREKFKKICKEELNKLHGVQKDN